MEKRDWAKQQAWIKAHQKNLAVKVSRPMAEHLERVANENGDSIGSILRRGIESYLEEKGEPYIKK